MPLDYAAFPGLDSEFTSSGTPATTKPITILAPLNPSVINNTWNSIGNFQGGGAAYLLYMNALGSIGLSEFTMQIKFVSFSYPIEQQFISVSYKDGKFNFTGNYLRAYAAYKPSNGEFVLSVEKSMPSYISSYSMQATVDYGTFSIINGYWGIAGSNLPAYFLDKRYVFPKGPIRSSSC